MSVFYVLILSVFDVKYRAKCFDVLKIYNCTNTGKT